MQRKIRRIKFIYRGDVDEGLVLYAFIHILAFIFKGVFVVNVILFHYFSNVRRTMFCSEPLALNMLSEMLFHIYPFITFYRALTC